MVLIGVLSLQPAKKKKQLYMQILVSKKEKENADITLIMYKCRSSRSEGRAYLYSTLRSA